METIIIAVVAVVLVAVALGYTVRLITYAMSDESVIDNRLSDIAK